jgi:hypothetical protein
MNGTAFFLHIPRTAGTTLNTVLRNNFAPAEIIEVYDQADYAAHARHSAEELRGVRLIQGHLLLQCYDPPRMYGAPVQVFTFLRDPIERLVSEYAFLRAWKANHMYAYLNDNNVSFRDYILSDEPKLRYRGRNFMTRCVAGRDTGAKAYPLTAVALAKRHLERVFGFVGLQERFMESLLLLGDFLGLRNLLHEKRNALHTEAKPALSAGDIALAREVNQGDQELYDFAAALFAERVAARGSSFAKRMKAFTLLNDKFQKMGSLLTRDLVKNPDERIAFPKDGLL